MIEVPENDVGKIFVVFDTLLGKTYISFLNE